MSKKTGQSWTLDISLMVSKNSHYALLLLISILNGWLIMLDQGIVVFLILTTFVIVALNVQSRDPSWIFRLFIVFALFLIIFPDEFARGTGNNFVYNRDNFFYKNIFYKVRTVDILVVGTFVYYLLSVRPTKIFPLWTPVNAPILLFFLWLPLPFLKGLLSGGTTVIFGTWKNIVLGVLFFTIFLDVINSKNRVQNIMWLFFVMVLLNNIYGLTKMFLGKGILTKLGYYVPFFYNGADIVTSLAAFLYGFGLLVNYRTSGLKKVLLVFGCSVMFMIVIITFRRGFWVQLVIGIAIILYFSDIRSKIRTLTYGFFFLMFLLVLANTKFVPVSIHNVLSSFESINVFESGKGEHYHSNQRHIDNIVIGFRVLMKEGPVLGYGIGRKFTRSDLYDFASIHNGILKTWFWFGIGGLLSYLLFFLLFFKYYLERVRNMSTEAKGYTIGFFSIIVSSFIVSAIFVPPYYSSFSGAILMFFFLASVFSFIHFTETEVLSNPA